MLLRPENVWFQDAAGAGLSNWFEVVTDVVFGSYTRHFMELHSAPNIRVRAHRSYGSPCTTHSHITKARDF